MKKAVLTLMTQPLGYIALYLYNAAESHATKKASTLPTTYINAQIIQDRSKVNDYCPATSTKLQLLQVHTRKW